MKSNLHKIINIPKIFIPVIHFFFTGYTGICQETQLAYNDTVYNEKIKTTLLYNENDKLSDPVLRMGYQEKLVLTFDELSSEIGNYYYTFIHCGANWEPTSLMQSEYIEGFSYEQITDYELSFNTNIDYIHYTVKFPNENVSLKLSGNYIIKVYANFNENDMVLARRFSIIDPIVKINAQVKKPIMSKYMEDGQEIAFKVITGNPLIFSNNELNYEFHEGNVFQGGSEFRYFNIKSIRYQSEYIKSIEFARP